jgi:hypothetical protein
MLHFSICAVFSLLLLLFSCYHHSPIANLAVCKTNRYFSHSRYLLTCAEWLLKTESGIQISSYTTTMLTSDDNKSTNLKFKHCKNVKQGIAMMGENKKQAIDMGCTMFMFFCTYVLIL